MNVWQPDLRKKLELCIGHAVAYDSKVKGSTVEHKDIEWYLLILWPRGRQNAHDEDPQVLGTNRVQFAAPLYV